MSDNEFLVQLEKRIEDNFKSVHTVMELQFNHINDKLDTIEKKHDEKIKDIEEKQSLLSERLTNLEAKDAKQLKRMGFIAAIVTGIASIIGAVAASMVKKGG
jgi:SPX domain protein involved in polyphosphate accumulation